ncbi:MAG: APC family permease [Bifidobacteriaceae bacterium]|jgi:amino acid transporter|nr:APC family permease [Bifidobacteriaceae bacterium]
MAGQKKFRLFDAVLAAVCVILVVEAAAPSAAIGSSQYFWWVLLLIAFFLPYGMVSAELGTTYTGEGGLFDWVNRAFGRSWGSRVAWYYWINFPLWMASLAVLAVEVVDQAFGITIPLGVALPAQLAFIWLVCYLSNHSVVDNALLINIATFFKIVLMVALGGLGIYFAATRGVANPITSPTDLLPGLSGISFIAIIIFNFLGFEVVTTFADDMDNPRRQIPKALLLGGILVAFFYLFASFGIGVAVPIDELTTNGGLLDSFAFFFGGLGLGRGLLIAVGLMFIFTLAINLLSWALGVNHVAMHAADHRALPRAFGRRKKGTEDIPFGASMLNGAVASVLVLLAPVISAITGDDSLFWSFFALQIITLLTSYVILFPAFKRLRRIDPDAERPYRVKGGPVRLGLITWVPVVLLVLAVFFCIAWPEEGGWVVDKTLLAGAICALVAGEIVTWVSGRAPAREPAPNKQ